MERARTVLVVDELEAHRQRLTMLLQAHLDDATSAADGFEALAYRRGHPQDAIILDVGMPGMSGFEARRIRRLRRLQAVPIVIVTSLIDDHTRRLTRDCGAAQIVAKPISGTDLRATLQRPFA